MLQTTDACGLPKKPVGPCLMPPRFYRVRLVVSAGQTLLDIEQVVEKNFLWRGVSAPSVSNLKVRFRSPGNVYHSSARVPLNMCAQGGYNVRALEPEVFVPKGQAVTIEAENTSLVDISTYVVLVGVDRLALE